MSSRTDSAVTGRIPHVERPRNLATVAAFVVVSVALTALAACGGRDAAADLRRADSATFAAIRAESATAVRVAASAPSSRWDVDHVAQRLVRAGVAPRRIDPPPDVPAFFATATASAGFVVGRGGELRVFVFADSLARKRATDGLDPRNASPRGERRAWPLDPVGPLLIINHNLAAVLLGGTSVLHERVQLALEAGLGSS